MTPTPPNAGEPVGYLITWNNPRYRGIHTLSTDPCDDEDGTYVPVYTHPQPNAGVVTDEMVAALRIARTGLAYAGQFEFQEARRRYVNQFAKEIQMIEAALSKSPGASGREGETAVPVGVTEGVPAGLEAIARWIEAGCFNADRSSVRRTMAENVRAFILQETQAVQGVDARRGPPTTLEGLSAYYQRLADSGYTKESAREPFRQVAKRLYLAALAQPSEAGKECTIVHSEDPSAPAYLALGAVKVTRERCE